MSRSANFIIVKTNPKINTKLYDNENLNLFCPVWREIYPSRQYRQILSDPLPEIQELEIGALRIGRFSPDHSPKWLTSPSFVMSCWPGASGR